MLNHRPLRQALRGITAMCPNPRVRKHVFTGTFICGRGCRNKCAAGGTSHPPVPVPAGRGSLAGDGWCGWLSPSPGTALGAGDGANQAHPMKHSSAHSQISVRHLCTPLQRVGAQPGCSWEASPPPCAPPKDPHVLHAQSRCRKVQLPTTLLEKCQRLSLVER